MLILFISLINQYFTSLFDFDTKLVSS